jgi:hypothetical protein
MATRTHVFPPAGDWTVLSAGNRTRRRSLGLLVILFYLSGSLGTAAVAMARDLFDASVGVGTGACGCTSGADCCGAACCSPEPAAASCCDEPAADPAIPDCCAGGSEPVVAVTTAFVATCTCGQRDHQHAPASHQDLHVPAGFRACVCPPGPDLLDGAWRVGAAAWRPEPRDRVPKRASFSA